MAFIRNCFFIAVAALCVFNSNAQTVSYPLLSSQLLKSTAEDAAMLLQKSMPGSQFTTQPYSSMPVSGIIFIYDATITDNQACKVESDGISFIKFTAAEDNGLCFGFYQYLHNSGFRFYQPGPSWEIIPSLSSAYKKTDTIFTTDFKYKSWFISGGNNRWIMDNSTAYSWDSYFGENGHNLALYQRRNGMLGANRFAGHRGDIMTGNYIAALEANPCYIACYNNLRIANNRSVPDVNSQEAMKLWSSAIEQKYTQYKDIILGNTGLYVNQYRNFNYGGQNIGIEVPDGSQWGNSKDNGLCSNTDYSSASDQQFTLSNFTAQKISDKYPGKRFQLYAYAAHADVPNEKISINDNLDIQLIPAVYQNITSANGLRNRWYKRSKNISEYNYLNLSGWSGETPAFYLDDFKATVQIAKDKKSQGLVWEASPAKFASLPYLLAANNDLKDQVSIDNTLQEFCDNMFAGAANTIYTLLQLWTDSKIMAGGFSNKYKIPLYLKMISEAEQLTKEAPAVLQSRILELKAYLHYMILYFDWVCDQRTDAAKVDKAAALCIYLAKTNKLQLVNSYYLITVITAKYPGSNFYQQYNTANGSAYQNGNLPLITDAEIEGSFQNDKARYNNLIDKYSFESAAGIKDQLAKNNLNPLKKISVQLSYTYGMDYYNRAEFNIIAPAAGSFTIDYNPRFDMPDKGYINFIVESQDKVLEILKDFTIDRNAKPGTLTVTLPSSGNYKLSVFSKYKSAVDLDINTNGNYFYKSGSFLGTTTEKYQTNLLSIPGYFYIPDGIDKLYFTISNSNPGGAGFASAEKINNAFDIKDISGNTLQARFVTPTDSALFYIDIPAESKGKFGMVSKMGAYSLVFSNISNVLWYAEPKPKPCSNANFTIAVINNKGNCITRLTAVSKSEDLEWEVTDMGQTYKYSKQAVVELPDYSSPNAVVTLTNGIDCSVTKRVRDDEKYLRAKEACASGAVLPAVAETPLVYPNPSNGVFNLLQSGTALTANEIIVTNLQGLRIGVFKNVKQFNISHVTPGLYLYKMIVDGQEFTGKLLKL